MADHSCSHHTNSHSLTMKELLIVCSCFQPMGYSMPIIQQCTLPPRFLILHDNHGFNYHTTFYRLSSNLRLQPFEAIGIILQESKIFAIQDQAMLDHLCPP